MRATEGCFGTGGDGFDTDDKGITGGERGANSAFALLCSSSALSSIMVHALAWIAHS